MEFGRAFSLPFKDPNWFKKMIINGLVMLIPIIGSICLFGWGIEIARRIIKGEPSDTLPELDFGGQLATGFKAWVIGLVYAIPLIIFSIPMQVIPLLGDALGLDADTLSYAVIGISVCCGGLSLIYGILMGFMLPAAIGKYLDTGQLGAAFRVGEIFTIVKSAPVAFLLVILGSIIASFVSSLGTIACIVGILITAPYAMAIVGNLYGQAYKQAVTKSI
jgi:hypothetical protein